MMGDDQPEADRERGRAIRLVMVEDQLTILAQQQRLLETFDELQIVATARDGARALQLIEQHRPDAVLLDLGLPDIDGIEVTRRIKGCSPRTEILIFTIFDDEARVLEAVRAGASGYLLKGAPAARIVEALREVCAGGSVIQPRLTPRETEILALIAQGMSNRVVAETLGVSRATVRTHLEHIYAKLEVSNRTEAVTEAIRQGIIEP